MVRARKYYPGMGTGLAEVAWLDDEDLEFGDDADVTAKWNATDSVLEFLPATDDVGAVRIGNGTLDMDFQVIMGVAGASVLFDNSVARVIFEQCDLRIMDTDILEFGDDADVTFTWDNNSLNILPLVNDTGRIEFGDGTTDMDVIFFMGDTLNSLLVDVGNQVVTISSSLAGSGSARALHVDCDPLAGTAGFRAGAIGIVMDRAVGQDFAGGWDGNPDTGLRIRQANRAANAVSRGAAQGLDVEGRNRDNGVVAWARGGYIAGRNDNLGEVDFLWGLFIRCENNGQINTEAIGLDVDMSIDDDTGNPTTTAIRIRSNGIVAPAVLDQVFLISHAQANGWDNLFYFNAVTGDTVEAGTLTKSGAGDVECDFRIKCSVNGVDYWIPMFNTAP